MVEAKWSYIYMQARFYDPIGRFLSPDPIEFNGSNPFAFNRYAYANNNPYTYKDPNGESPVALGFAIGGGVLGLAVTGTVDLISVATGGGWSSGGTYAGAFLGGAAAGATLAMSGNPVTAGMVGGQFQAPFSKQ